MSELLRRITIGAGKNGGRPSIRGLRIRVQDVLEMPALGMSAEQILADFPYLGVGDIRASLAYASAQASGTAVGAA